MTPRPIELTVHWQELQDPRRAGFRTVGEMLGHILTAAGFRVVACGPHQAPQLAGRWERIDCPRGNSITYRQWGD